MSKVYTAYLVTGLWFGCVACSDGSAAASGKQSVTDSADEESDTEVTEEQEEPPKKKDAGKSTVKRDAGKPPAADEDSADQDSDGGDVDVPTGGKDAGQKLVDAGHAHPDAAWSVPDAGATSGGKVAQDFCDAYGMYCGYGKAQRHKDEAACLADFNGNPAQQGCKIMHLSTSMEGTAAACNGMQSAFCFSIHCLHAAGLTDQTGVTYCK